MPLLSSVCMQSYEAIRPHAETAWKHASVAHKTAYAKGSEWYEAGSKKGQELWQDAGPMLHETHTSLKACPCSCTTTEAACGLMVTASQIAAWGGAEVEDQWLKSCYKHVKGVVHKKRLDNYCMTSIQAA